MIAGMLRNPDHRPEIVNIDGQDYLCLARPMPPFKPPTQAEWEAAGREWVAAKKTRSAENRLRALRTVKALLKLEQ
jgi:hypothetical protein